MRSNRFSLFLPAGALMTTSVIAISFKLIHLLDQEGHAETLVHLIVFTRRLNELEAAGDGARRT